MKRFNNTVLAAAFCLGLMMAVGCSSGCQRTLAPGGVYQDKVIYEADNAIKNSHALLQDFVTWEASNRAVLAQWPDIRKAADKIFTEGPAMFASMNALKEAYAADPTDANRAALQTSLNIIKQLVHEVAGYYARKGQTPQVN
jgi:hypothetical protein